MSRFLIFLVLLQAAPALSQETPSQRTVYARIGDVEITVAQLQAAADAAGARTRTEVQAIADELVDHEVLLLEARRRGLDRHVLVRDAWRTFMVQHFMHHEFDVRLPRAGISDEAIRARFDEDPAAYRRGLEASTPGIRGALWRERRDAAVQRLLSACRERTPVQFYPELLATIPVPEVTPREQFVSRYGCAHCARQLENNPATPTTVFGSPVPAVPDWARRGASSNMREGSP